MKVLHLIDSAGLYGAEVVLLYLIAEQKKQGIKPILGSIGKPEIIEKYIETTAKQNFVEVKKFRMENGPNLLGAISIIRFAKKKHIDLIHCHGYKGNILMGLLPAHFRTIPYLLTMHGSTAVKKFSKMWIYYWVDALFAKRANLLVVVSEAMLSHPLNLKVGLKPAVVHNGIPHTTFVNSKSRPSAHPIIIFSNRHFTIGAIGRLSPEKGLDLLVNAVANVIDTGRNVSLVIIGGGRERQKLGNLARTRGICDKVLYTGYLDKASQYLKCFDVFVISSLTEGLPITLLEAMQARIPIIATQVGGIPEVLHNGRSGILVNPGDEHDLIEAIIKLYDSPRLRKQLCTVAKKRVNEFSSEKMELGYRKLYEKLLRI